MNDDLLELSMWRDGNIMHENCIEDMNKLKEERDEARRELCKRVESASCLSDGEPTTLASDYASWCGWDCFKEDGK